MDVVIKEWWMLKNELLPQDDIPIGLTIENQGFSDLDGNVAVKIDGDDFFTQSIVPIRGGLKAFSETQVTLNLATKHHTNLKYLPKVKEIVVINAKREILGSLSISIPIVPYLNKLMSLPGGRLMIWGQLGTGKSSFLNTFKTLFTYDPNFPNAVHKLAMARSTAEHVSINISEYDIGSCTIADPWGWSEDEMTWNWTDVLWQFMLNGQLEGVTMAEAKRMVETNNFTKIANNPKKPYDVVVFAMTVVAAQNEAYVKRIGQLIKVATTHSKNQKRNPPSFVILLTQVDNVDPKLRENPYIDHPQLRSVITKVSGLIEFQAGDIVPVVNYTEEYERTWELDRAGFVALQQIYLKLADRK